MIIRGEASAPPHHAQPNGLHVALSALTVLFGVQALRTLVPLLVFIFRDRFGWPALAVGGLAMAAFATGFLAVVMRRAVGPRRWLAICVIGVGGFRLALQLWNGDPIVDFVLALFAVVLFFQIPPLILTAGGSGPGFPWFLGWLVGLSLDTSLHGVYGTYDMSWRDDVVTSLVVVALVVIQAALWVMAMRTRVAVRSDVQGRPAWGLVALGPFLFLELMVVGNIARLSALTGWAPEVSAAWVSAGRWLVLWLVSSGLAAVVTRTSRWSRWLLPGGLAAILVLSLWAPWQGGWAAAILLLITHFSSVLLLAMVMLAIATESVENRPVKLTVGHGLGLMALGSFVFLYYGSIDIRLPFSPDALLPVAAVVIGLVVLAARSSNRPVWGMPVTIRSPRALLAVGLLTALPLAKLATAPTVASEPAEGFPLRLMTYNLHCGLDPLGHLGLEAIAATIEAERPDIVALQEVSRGWLVNSSVDMVSWLSRRLGMSYVFASTADPLWGNAVLSRRPITSSRTSALPTEDLLIGRGLLAAQIDLGAEGHLEVIVTHFHDPEDGGAIRELQSQAILDFWQGRSRTVLTGDFNARPGSQEIEMLRRAGLRDVFDVATVAPGYTHPSTAPRQRIDYIWTSLDLQPRDVRVPVTRASDHLPVVATLDAE